LIVADPVLAPSETVKVADVTADTGGESPEFLVTVKGFVPVKVSLPATVLERAPTNPVPAPPDAMIFALLPGAPQTRFSMDGVRTIGAAAGAGAVTVPTSFLNVAGIVRAA